MSYRAVLFDLFDTLLYVTPTANRQKAVALLGSLGISMEDWWHGWRSSFDAAVRGQTADLAERVGLTLGEAGAPPLPPDVVASLVGLLDTRSEPALYPDVKETVAELRRRDYKVGLISNLTSDEKSMLDQFNLRSLFDVSVASYEVGLAKPERAIFRHAAERLRLAPEECVFVDDQPPYLAGAIDVGMCGILIRRSNAHDWDGVGDIRCALRITELSELLDWLPRQAGSGISRDEGETS